jgi:YD repeat-containing protein
MNERTKKELRFWIVVSTLVVVAFFTSRYLTGRPKVPDTSRIPIPSAKWDGRYPCVTMDFANASARPAVKRCSVATENNAATDGVEVDLRWGKFILRQTDLFVIDDMPIVLTRTYNSREWSHPNPVHAFGRNANHRYDMAPVGTRNPYTFMMIVFEDGDLLYFPRVSPGTSFDDAAYRHSDTSGAYYGAVQQWEGAGWRLKRADGYTVHFPDSYSATNTAQGGPYEISNAQGRLILERNSDRDLLEIRGNHGHFIRFQYDDQHRITKAETDAGDWRVYRYDLYGMLTDVVTPRGIARHYDYIGKFMTAVTDEHGVVLLRNGYKDDVLVRQDFLKGGSFGYAYEKTGHYFSKARVDMPDQKSQVIDTEQSVPDYIKHGLN